MTRKPEPRHVVVDGSNIATEGRSMPSLTQLNDAVLAYIDEHPDSTITVVVDATFGHRIDKSEVKEFDTAIANNELVAPPAGAVGRGDAFVLGIADKAKATVLSNDSFQEFHGEYEWLFDEGRLVGGKPVPNVGWVFVPRVPVRGPVSRKATRGTRSTKKAAAPAEPASRGSRRGRGRSGEAGARASKEASQPMPVPTAPPPGRAPAREKASSGPAPAPARPSGSSNVVNELMPFLDFVEHHPVGTSVNAIVESYSSHGAYVTIGDVRGYVPLRLMADPPPRSAREIMKIGDAVTLVVTDFAPSRRSIDCAVPHMAAGVAPEDPSAVIDAATAEAEQAPASLPGEHTAEESGEPFGDERPATQTRIKKAAAKKAAAKKSAAKKAPAKKAAAKKSAAKSAVKKAPAKKAAAKKSAAKSAVKKAPAKTTPAKQPAPNSASAKQAPLKKSAPRKLGAKKATAQQSAADAPPIDAPDAATGGV